MPAVWMVTHCLTEKRSGVLQMWARADDASEAFFYKVHGDVGTGERGLFAELALYTQNRHKNGIE